MEQTSGGWEYRLKWKGEEFGPAVPSYAVYVKVPLENFVAAVEGEWRPSAAAGAPDSEWLPMPPMDLAKTKGRFAVRIRDRRDFRDDGILDVISLVRGDPAWFRLAMPKRIIAADGPEELVVDGEAGTCAVANVIANKGDFFYADDCYQVGNLDVSLPGLVLVDAAIPAVNPNLKGGFMAFQGRMPPEEIEKLKEWLNDHV